jgi:hypothetical protein
MSLLPRTTLHSDSEQLASVLIVVEAIKKTPSKALMKPVSKYVALQGSESVAFKGGETEIKDIIETKNNFVFTGFYSSVL